MINGRNLPPFSQVVDARQGKISLPTHEGIQRLYQGLRDFAVAPPVALQTEGRQLQPHHPRLHSGR